MARPHAEGGLPDDVKRPLDLKYLAKVLPLVHERLKTLNEAPEALSFFFTELVRPDPAEIPGKKSSPQEAISSLKASLDLLAKVEPFEAERLEHEFRALADSMGIKAGQLFTPVRVAVTGTTMAPPLFETIAAIGRERCVKRVQAAIELLSGSAK
jgi:glutamyl-tRNA synthetase